MSGSFKYNGATIYYNPDIIIYNNSGKSFDFTYAINGKESTPFVTGVV